MQNNNQLRVKSLDSLRGIAAFVVMLGHCYLASKELQDKIEIFLHSLNKPLYILAQFFYKFLTAGRSAVILFFVLSGFVLTVSLLNKKQPYKSFIISRFFRIYPVLFISIILSYVLRLWLGYSDNPFFSSWYRSDITPDIPLSLPNLFGHLVLTGIAKNHIFLNSPLWSLVYEVRISILFPFLILLFSKGRAWLMLALSLVLSLISAYLVLTTTGVAARGYTEESFLATLLTTGYFVFFFAIGIILAIKQDKISIIINRLSESKKYAVLGIKFLLLILAAASVLYDKRYFNFYSLLMDYWHILGSAIFIILAINWHGLSNLLSVRPLLWLGHISYSLYLIHLPVIFVVFETFGGKIPCWLVISITIATSLFMADLMARFVEYPCMRLGKKISSKTTKI